MSELILKEDALDCFHDWIDMYGYEHTADEDTVYQRIEALDAVRCYDEDCISRRVAIDAIDDIESEVTDGFGFQYEKWRKYFCELPAVQPDHNADVSKKVDVDDCISRRAVKEKLKQNLTYMRAFGVDRCLELIDEIPAVETEPKWISCKEKMPEENLWTVASQQYSYGVLMYVLDYSDGDTIIDFGHTIDGKWYSDTADTYVENYSCRVIAWMLPPSYKENK